MWGLFSRHHALYSSSVLCGRTTCGSCFSTLGTLSGNSTTQPPILSSAYLIPSRYFLPSMKRLLSLSYVKTSNSRSVSATFLRSLMLGKLHSVTWAFCWLSRIAFLTYSTILSLIASSWGGRLLALPKLQIIFSICQVVLDLYLFPFALCVID